MGMIYSLTSMIRSVHVCVLGFSTVGQSWGYSGYLQSGGIRLVVSTLLDCPGFCRRA